MDWKLWYDQLAKPRWTPSGSKIGLILTILYPIIFITCGFVFYKAVRRQLPWMVALPFAINLISNLLFTPIFFRMRMIPLATADILVVLGTIVWGMVAIWPYFRLLAVAQIPYLIWVCIATVLQVSITAMNWGKT